jgi:hypothetical protein
MPSNNKNISFILGYKMFQVWYINNNVIYVKFCNSQNMYCVHFPFKFHVFTIIEKWGGWGCEGNIWINWKWNKKKWREKIALGKGNLKAFQLVFQCHHLALCLNISI